jgi:hypothetical protein
MHLSRDEGKERGRTPRESTHLLPQSERTFNDGSWLADRTIHRGQTEPGESPDAKVRRNVPGEVLELETPAGSPAAQQNG